MGYDNIKGIHAKKIEVLEKGSNTKSTKVALFVQIADSNLWETNSKGTEVMSRSWKLFKIAAEYSVMSSVVEFSSSCEGGMLKYMGKDVGAETVIRACRKEIANADFVDNLSTSIHGHNVEPIASKLDCFIELKEIVNRGSFERDQIKKLIELKKPTRVYDGYLFSWGTSPEDISEYLEYEYLFKSRVHWTSIREPWDWSYAKKMVNQSRKTLSQKAA